MLRKLEYEAADHFGLVMLLLSVRVELFAVCVHGAAVAEHETDAVQSMSQSGHLCIDLKMYPPIA